jgi:hypothetical protein
MTFNVKVCTMNTTLPIFPGITPLKALWRWLITETGQTGVGQIHRRRCSPSSPANAPTLRTQVLKASPDSSNRQALRRPVRVLRVMEADQSPMHGGRIRISGCMADVCAELDRLAARESRLH